MNKKGKQNKNSNKFLLITLTLLFMLTLYISIQYIVKYYNSQKLNNVDQIIEVKTKDTKVSIVNNGTIEKIITKDAFIKDKEIIIENIDSIEIMPNNKNESKTTFDIKYEILENHFKLNNSPSNKSEVLVRFSYSYDKENWTYVNNVISTNTNNIMPLTGNIYDVAGIATTLNVATDYELVSTNKETKKMYWRSETIFKNINNITEEKTFKANFTIGI